MSGFQVSLLRFMSDLLQVHIQDKPNSHELIVNRHINLTCPTCDGKGTQTVKHVDDQGNTLSVKEDRECPTCAGQKELQIRESRSVSYDKFSLMLRDYLGPYLGRAAVEAMRGLPRPQYMPEKYYQYPTYPIAKQSGQSPSLKNVQDEINDMQKKLLEQGLTAQDELKKLWEEAIKESKSND